MIRRAFLLNGLAILAVVCNHAAAWGYTAMYWWTDSYRPVAVPSFDQVGSLPYYGLLMMRQLAVFSVPAFLFVSGLFIAYAAKGSRSGLSWRVVRIRIVHLLIPFLIWSSVIFFGDLLQGIVYPAHDYLRRLIVGGAHPAYFYVPLLCQFYLLAPWIARLARARWRLLLLAAAIVQFGAISLQYLNLLWGDQVPFLKIAHSITPSWLFPRWIFFFALGVVAGFQPQRLGAWLEQHKWGLLSAVIVLASMVIIEPEVVYRSTGSEWRGGPVFVSGNLYAVAFILCFLAFHRVEVPLLGSIHHLATHSYGIYLVHPLLLEILARAIRKVTPGVLAYQVFFALVLAVSAVGLALLLMMALAKSPLRRSSRYLFG